MRRKAFTLIELLVVISIIALLISIMIPALGRAKKVAQRVVCASHLKSTGTGIYLYAGKNNGTLPEGQYKPATEDKTGVSPGDFPVYAYVLFYLKPGADAYDMEQLLPQERVHRSFGFGKLFTDKLIEEGEVYYCPSAVKKPNEPQHFAYQFYSNGETTFPFLDTEAANPYRTRSSYMYVPQHSRRKVELRRFSNNYFPDVAKKTQDMKPTSVMSCDVLYNLEWLSHKKGKDRGGVNALFADGSVAFVNNPDAFNQELWGTATEPRDLVGNELNFRNVLKALE